MLWLSNAALRFSPIYVLAETIVSQVYVIYDFFLHCTFACLPSHSSALRWEVEGFPRGAQLLTELYNLLQAADTSTAPLLRYLFSAAVRPYWCVQCGRSSGCFCPILIAFW